MKPTQKNLRGIHHKANVRKRWKHISYTPFWGHICSQAASLPLTCPKKIHPFGLVLIGKKLDGTAPGRFFFQQPMGSMDSIEVSGSFKKCQVCTMKFQAKTEPTDSNDNGKHLRKLRINIPKQNDGLENVTSFQTGLFWVSNWTFQFFFGGYLFSATIRQGVPLFVS